MVGYRVLKTKVLVDIIFVGLSVNGPLARPSPETLSRPNNWIQKYIRAINANSNQMTVL